MKKNILTFYIIGVILLFAIIFIIWAIDTKQISSHADVGPTIESAQQLNSLPNPDQSTFSKIFGAIIKPFSK